MHLISSKTLLLYWLHRKKKLFLQLSAAKKKICTWDQGYLCHVASQPASPKWRPIPEITWHHIQSPLDWSIKPLRVISIKTSQLVCLLLCRIQISDHVFWLSGWGLSWKGLLWVVAINILTALVEVIIKVNSDDDFC